MVGGFVFDVHMKRIRHQKQVGEIIPKDKIRSVGESAQAIAVMVIERFDHRCDAVVPAVVQKQV